VVWGVGDEVAIYSDQPTPGLTVKLKMNGRDFLFLVDTGASNHSLDERIAQSLGYQTINARILPLKAGVSQNLFGMDCLREKLLAFAPPNYPMVWMRWPN
jgi:hypothetical protein